VSKERMERVQLMLSPELSAWLDQLSSEIREHTGASVSRSEITRAALTTLRELHRLGEAACVGKLAGCKSCAELTIAGVATVRSSVRRG
jgi:hypothetical protein